MRADLSAGEARGIALAAQGFDKPRRARATTANVRALAARQHLFQIDSVNVLVRAHYMPAFSRLGPYDMSGLDALAYTRRELFEYWGHEASLIRTQLYPLLRWRMAQMYAKPWFKHWDRKNPGLLDAIYEEVRARGPLGVSDLEQHRERGGPWWGWSQGKFALEMLLGTGRLAVATRRNFERVYDLSERVIPRAVLEAREVDERAAQRELLLLGARSLGIGTAADIADYFRIHKPTARGIVKEMERDGELQRVTVEGWRDPAFVVPGTKVARAMHARALVSPFDPLVWERARAERLFGFRYRIEIYVPAHKRIHGYYVLPFLFGDRFAARVDLKADRARSMLVVHAAYAEPEAPAGTAAALVEELGVMAEWLGLERVKVANRGDLARALKRAAS